VQGDANGSFDEIPYGVLRSAASPGSVGWAGVQVAGVASSAICRRPPLSSPW